MNGNNNTDQRVCMKSITPEKVSSKELERWPARLALHPVPLLPTRLPAVEDDLQPARAAADELAGVALAPALHKANLHREARPWLLHELMVIGPLQAVRLLIVKSLDGETREHLVHQQRPGVRVVQCGGLDEDGVTAAVVNPHAIHFPRQLDATANLAPHLLDQLTLVVRIELSEAKAIPLR